MVAAAIVACAAASAASVAGDPVKGEKLHEPCLQCHGTAIYVPPRAKVKSLSQLRRETAKWGDYYNPKLTKQEVEHLVAYLNRDFYKFPE